MKRTWLVLWVGFSLLIITWFAACYVTHDCCQTQEGCWFTGRLTCW